MNSIRHDLGSEIEYVNLYPIADLHLGSNHHNKKELLALIDVINNDPNGYVVLNGDLINNAIRNSVSDIYEERMSPEKQIDELVEIFKPIREKILSITTGNHEVRTWKVAGIDVTRNFCYRLGLEDLYNPVSNVIFLSFGKNRKRDNVRNTFSIYHTHGRGGGSTTGAKANRLHKLSQIVQANIYIHSHTHTPLIFKEDYFISNCANKGISRESRLFINTNAYEGFGGYGEVLGLRPSNHEYIKVKLWFDEKGKKYYSGTL
jgi:predicted phosphodiesterase